VKFVLTVLFRLSRKLHPNTGKEEEKVKYLEKYNAVVVHGLRVPGLGRLSIVLDGGGYVTSDALCSPVQHPRHVLLSEYYHTRTDDSCLKTLILDYAANDS